MAPRRTIRTQTLSHPSEPPQSSQPPQSPQSASHISIFTFAIILALISILISLYLTPIFPSANKTVIDATNPTNLTNPIELLYEPYTCTSYDPYLSHLSTKTPYNYRHAAYPHEFCHDNSDSNETCHGPTCGLQIAQVGEIDAELGMTHFDSNVNLFTTTESPSKQCVLRHVSHLNRHGTRNPTKAGLAKKVEKIISQAQKSNGLVQHLIDGGNASKYSNWFEKMALDTTTVDPALSDREGGTLSDVGRLELFGIGQRLRSRVDLIDFLPNHLLGSVTFKKRTLHSLLALLCGMGLYGIEGKRTGGGMKELVKNSEKIKLHGIRTSNVDNSDNNNNNSNNTLEWALPHVRVNIPQDIIDSVRHILYPGMEKINHGHNGNDSEDSMRLLKLIKFFEKEFILSIARRYPITHHPLYTPLVVKLVTFTPVDENKMSINPILYHQPKISNCQGSECYQKVDYSKFPRNYFYNNHFLQLFDFSIPPQPDGTSPIIELLQELNYTFPPISRADNLYQIDPTPSRISQPIPSVPHTRSELDNLPIDYFHSHHEFSRSWSNAVLRYFDECGQYDTQTTKSPQSWQGFASSYITEMCGDGTHCDFALHGVFKTDYLDNVVFDQTRYDAIVQTLSEIIKHNEIVVNDGKVEEVDGVIKMTGFDQGLFIQKFVSQMMANNHSIYPNIPHDLPTDEVRKLLSEWVETLIKNSSTVQKKSKKTDKAKKKEAEAKLKEELSSSDDNSGNKKAKKADKSIKSKFPQQYNFSGNPKSLFTFFTILLESLQQSYSPTLSTTNPKSPLYGDNTTTQVLNLLSLIHHNEAQEKLKIVKKIYSVCSIQLSVHSPVDSTFGNNADLNGEGLIQNIPFSNQFCSILSNTHFDEVVLEYSAYIQTKKQSSIVTIEEIQQDKEFLAKLYRKLHEKLNAGDNTPQFSKHGSPLFYQAEYLTDIAQFAKKGAYSKITMSSACPLLETLLPSLNVTTFSQNIQKPEQTMSIYGAHAETVLPLVALITGHHVDGGIVTKPPIPKPNIDHFLQLDQSAIHEENKSDQNDNINLNLSKFNQEMCHIYSYDLPQPQALDRYQSSGSPFVDGLYLTKTHNNHPIRVSKGDQNDVITLENNPGWRSSYHTPMGANVGIYIYECTDIDHHKVNNTNGRSKLYAQLNLNEEQIPWPYDIPSEEVVGKVSMKSNSFVVNGGKNSMSTQNGSKNTTHSLIVPGLRPLNELKSFFLKRYEDLGMGTCNIKDWTRGCHVEGWKANANAADND
jgi:hypothetical protein